MNAIELPKLNRWKQGKRKTEINDTNSWNRKHYTKVWKSVRPIEACTRILQLTAVFKQQKLKIVTNVLSNSRRTKQQHLAKRFKRNTFLFYNTENAYLLVR